MSDQMTRVEAQSLLPAWEAMEPRASSARALRTVVALTDQVESLQAETERLRCELADAVERREEIGNEVTRLWTLLSTPNAMTITVGLGQPEIAHLGQSGGIKIQFTSEFIRDHLMAQLEKS